MIYTIPLFLFLFISSFMLVSPAAAEQKREIGLGSGKNSPDAGPIRNAISIAEMTGQDKHILALAKAAAGECAQAIENAVKSGQKSEEDIFSTLYFPILPLTFPPAFTTFYDDYTDKAITPIVDAYLAKDKAILSVGLVDINGYIPSHNSKYSQPLTGNPEIDIKRHRTKRIFNDIAGLQASRNTRPFLFQTYRRDTGETIAEVSVPVFALNRHWGTLRMLYERGE